MSGDSESRDGEFRLDGKDVWGRLTLGGPDTNLHLRTRDIAEDVKLPSAIYGRLHDFKYVSCIECVGGDLPTSTWAGEDERAMEWNIFPHQVVIGRRHFNSAEERINKAWFSTPDIHLIFDDHDSFGSLHGSCEYKQSLLPKTIGNRQVPVGPKPVIVYFAGRETILRASTAFGSIEVQYWTMPQSSSRGATIQAELRVEVAYVAPVVLAEALATIRRIGQFLSLVSGRPQGVNNLQVLSDGDQDANYFDVHWSYRPQQVDGQEIDTPSSFDIPLDGVRQSEEFERVIRNWFASDKHEIARLRLHSCREAANSFTVDRLVAAANMYDLTESDLVPEVSPELDDAMRQCLVILRAAPSSYERGSAIQAMKRIGAPTLMNKVMARARLLRGHFVLTDLDKVLRQAVLCRNYFVHGPGDTRFNYSAVRSHTAFLTEAMEFVFAAAELIECGWAAANWRLRPHTGHHWFVRFIRHYEEGSKSLLADVARTKTEDD